jgi:hypothetical protein
MVGLPCMDGRCAAEEHCEAGEQADPFDSDLKWKGCPAKRSLERRDIKQALTLRSAAAMAPLEGWPIRYTAGPAMTWMQMTADRQDRDRKAQEARRG